MHETIQYYWEAVIYERIQSSVLMLLFDLSNSNSKEELSNLIGLENQNLIKEMNIEAILNLPILDFNKFAGYSYFILRRESERFFLQVFLEILIPDYKLKSKDLDKINRKLAPLTKVRFTYKWIL